MILLGRRVPDLLPGEHGDPEHRERERGDGQARLHRVVLEDHLQEDRQRDHHPAQCDVLQHLSRDPEAEHLGSEQVRVEQDRLLLALPAHEPIGEGPESDRPDRQEFSHGISAFLPRQDAQHQPAHAEDGEDRTDRVHLSRTGVRHVANPPDAGEHDDDDQHLEQEADAPRQERRDEATEQRTDRGSDRG